MAQEFQSGVASECLYSYTTSYCEATLQLLQTEVPMQVLCCSPNIAAYKETQYVLTFMIQIFWILYGICSGVSNPLYQIDASKQDTYGFAT